MDTAFKNYLLLSRILENDMNALIGGECEDQSWRRNFIRAAAALIEGHVHGLREICVIILECPTPELSDKEKKVLISEKSFGAADRVMSTLSIAYELLELKQAPSFRDNDWVNAQQVFSKRNCLMHPKTPTDLEVSDSMWEDIRTGSCWLMKICLDIISLLEKKHGD